MALNKILTLGTFTSNTDSSKIVARAKDVNPMIDLLNLMSGGLGAPISLATSTLAAAGSTLATGSQCTGQLIFVTGADATKGVRLPVLSTNNGTFVIIVNTANAVLNIWPGLSTEKIQGGTAGAGIALAAYGVFLAGYKADGDWYATEITGGAVA